ncbi:MULTISPECIES: hypothetical protein [Anaeromyxobacter]|nr:MULTISPECIES: hypothetical protein [unclassified Anaeromyxobacter]
MEAERSHRRRELGEEPIPVAAGEVVERDGFTFADLLPRPAGDPAAQR